MVSDMKEWCNQYQCPNCKDRGYILIRNDDPLSFHDIVPRPCTCAAAKKLMEKSQYKPEPRMKWDFIWMNLAKSVGTRSTCRVPNRQVGCVIVSDDNTKVLAIGYNGSAKGDNNGCDYDGESNKLGNRCTCVHAEMNALVKLDTSNPCKKRVYLTLSPCSLCYKLIVNAGITEVIYDGLPYNENMLDELINLGVKVRKYENN